MRLDVEHGSAVDRVEPSDVELRTVDGEQFTGAKADSIRTSFGSLGEQPDERPVLPIPRMAGTEVNTRLIDPVEVEHHVDVGERSESGNNVGGEPVVQHDSSLDLPPVVIDRFTSTADDEPDRDHHDPS